MTVGVLVIQIHLPGCGSLKDKRRRLKPLLHRLHREFNISVSEIDHQDIWQDTTIACALVSNGRGHTQRYLQKVIRWIEEYWPDVSVTSEQIEII